MRSLLFVPGNEPRKLAKALGTGADALLIDLEDSVAPAHKQAARETVAAFLAGKVGLAGKAEAQATSALEAQAAPALYVRINGLDTDIWQADLTGVIAGRPRGIFVPKTRGGGDLRDLDAALVRAEAAADIAAGSTRILALVTETPISLLRMESYVGASARLEGLAWGGEDLSAALGARGNRDAGGAYTSPYLLARDLCLITAAAAGALAIDAAFVDYRHMAGLEAEARAAARDGFDAKMAIHPDQVPLINAAFTPSPQDIASAEAVIAAFSGRLDAGVVGLDGVMLDRPHLLRAHRTLEKARLAARD